MNKSAIVIVTVLICFASGLHGGSIPLTGVLFEARSNFVLAQCDCPLYEGAGSVNVSHSAVGLGGVGTYSGSGAATSAFGILSLYGSAEINGYAAGSNVGLSHIDSTGAIVRWWDNSPVFVRAGFTDTVTLSGPDKTYDLSLNMFLSGTTTITGDGIDARARIMAWASGPGYAHYSGDATYTTPGEYQLLIRNLPSNEPFDLTFYFDAIATITDQVWLTDSTRSDFGTDFSAAHIVGVVDHRTGPYSASVTMDFSHTARFGQYEVTLPDGSPTTGASLVSANGFAYEAVPEPSTVGMAALGLGAVLALLRRRSAA